MRTRFAVLLLATISCHTPPSVTITPLGAGQTYEPTPDSVPIALLVSPPECRHDAVAAITAEALSFMISDAALTDTLRARARSVGGHAIMNFTQGTRNVAPGSGPTEGEYRIRAGTAIRFRDPSCSR